MSLTITAANHLAERFKSDDWQGREDLVLNYVQHYIGKWRSQLVSNTILKRDGAVIQTGPFAGMDYVTTPAEGALAPRLLGTYECELHPYIAQILASKPETIVDIGCAEGYYAVGLARLAPWATIHAFDIDDRARTACAELAAKNGVQDRVLINGELTPDGLQRLCGQGAFVICDIEGAEADLLDPAKARSLARCSIIVETHPAARPGVTELLKSRFDSTHDVVEIRETVKDAPPGHWLRTLSLQDRFMATWEWRSTPTPWLVMTPSPLE